MELVYLPDPMTRLGSWISYSSWEETNTMNTVGKQQLKHCREVKTSEKNCSICQQKKKRSLSDYIRSKQTDYRNPTCIQEEDEEEDEKETKEVEENKS